MSFDNIKFDVNGLKARGLHFTKILVKNSQYVFKFKNKEFNILNFGYLKLDGDIKSFEYIEPNVYELEEWFHKNKIDIES